MIWRGRNESTEEPGDERRGDETIPEAAPGSVGTRIESVLDAAERAAIGIREDAQEWASRYLEESRRKADDAAAERIKEISALTDNLVSRAKAVAQQSDELISALDDAGRRMLTSARPGSAEAAPTNDVSQAGGQANPEAVQPPPAEVTPLPATQSERPPSARRAPAATPLERQPPPVQTPLPSREPAREAPPPPAPSPEAPPAAPAADAAPRVSEGARLLATQMAVAGSTRDEIAWRLREEFGIQDATAILDEIGI